MCAAHAYVTCALALPLQIGGLAATTVLMFITRPCSAKKRSRVPVASAVRVAEGPAPLPHSLAAAVGATWQPTYLGGATGDASITWQPLRRNTGKQHNYSGYSLCWPAS